MYSSVPTGKDFLYETYCNGKWNGYITYLPEEKVFSNGCIKSIDWLSVAQNNRKYLEKE
jgi:hypothetical protein